jgi:predicted transport protein
MPCGYVYILFNPSLRTNQFKIGLTTQTPEQRARELSRATGVPQPFEVAYSVYIEDCSTCERLMHEKLALFHAGKEFFELPLAIAVQTLNEVADVVGRARLPDKQPIEKEPSLVDGSIRVQTTEIEFGTPAAQRTSSRRARSGSISAQKSTVSFEDHLEKTDLLGKEILIEIQSKVKALGADVSERITRYNRIAYARGRIFLEVKVHKNRVRILFLDIVVEDPKGFVQKVPESHGWGRLKYLMNLRSLDDLAYAMPYIEASYRHALP